MTNAAAAQEGSTADHLRNALFASRRAFIAVGLFSFFTNLSTIVVPLYMLQVFTRVLSSRSESTLVMLTLVTVGLLFFFSILDAARSWVLSRVAGRFDVNIHDRLFAAVFEKGVSTPAGGHARHVRDLDTVRQFLGGSGIYAFFDAPWMPFFIAIIFVFHPLLGWIAVGGGLLLFTLALANEFVTRRAYGEISNRRSETAEFAETSLRNAEAVKAMGMLGNVANRWKAKHFNLLAAQAKANEGAAVIMSTAKFIRLTLQIGILGTGAYLVVQQQIIPGVMLAAAILVGRALQPLEQAVGQWRQFGNARAAYGRLKELLENAPPQRARMDLPSPSGELSVEKLVAGPPTVQMPVLRGLNFRLGSGESLGVIGPSGSGKTTLARLITGVWPARSGTVRLDGVDVHEWDSEKLGPYIGYLPQDVELFDGSVAENIARFGDVDADAVVRAAKLAGVHKMILNLPEGYDTSIGEGGAALSGGQRQRVGLARALYGDPVLLVLDEPNSNLDAQGEQSLVNTLRHLKQQGRTVVVISHRPNLLNHLDKVAILRNGGLEAFGPQEEVLKDGVVRPAIPAEAQPQQVQGG